MIVGVCRNFPEFLKGGHKINTLIRFFAIDKLKHDQVSLTWQPFYTRCLNSAPIFSDENIGRFNNAFLV